MSTESNHHEEHHGGPAVITHLLEMGDGWAHVLVSILLLLLALGILFSGTVDFITRVSHQASGAFATTALAYLSDLLFGVIVLELLSTILTYMKARNLEATVKDFLVVGLISSIRKILLVGAQSSLEKSTGDEFVRESIGTVISIVGIVLLIGGLLLLDRHRKAALESNISVD